MRFDMQKTNWERFKDKVKQEMITNEQSIHNKEQIKQNDIEDHITKWMDIITRNIEETTPKKAYKLYPNTKESMN